MKRLASGRRAPDFELRTPDGTSYCLQELLAAGSVILAFYKSTCPTCQLAFPNLQKAWAASGGTSAARLLGVSQDDPIETRRFVQEFGLTFDVVVDEEPHDVSSAYGLEYVPTFFIIGSDGVIRLSDSGFSKATLTEISKVIAQNAGQPVIPLFAPDDGLPASRPG
jgi:peroxiredoxin